MPTNDDDADAPRPPIGARIGAGGSADSRSLLLAGAIVQRADVGEHAAVLKVRLPGETTYVVAAAGAGLGMSQLKVPRPDGARAMARLEGFRVAMLRPSDALLSRGDEWLVVRAEARRITVTPATASVAGWDDAQAARASDRAVWLERGGSMRAVVAGAALDGKRGEAVRALRKGIVRLERRVAAVRGDMARIGDAEALAARAQWLVPEAARAPRGATSLRITDWSTGEAQVVEVPLDPSKPAKDQVQAMFQRARRLKLGAQIAEERLRSAEAACARLRAIEGEIAASETLAGVEAGVSAARAAAPKDVTFSSAAQAPGGRAGKGAQPRSLPFRTFHGASGARLLVGRGAAHNDALTFQTARPHDLWLHAKGRTGAHVIVPLAKNHTCPGDVLVEAAHLAAHFSDARDEAVVDVQYASRRHLRKPRGSAPGLVVVDREKVLAVRMEPSLLRALLDREE
jgi:hypothetical protein